MGLMGMRGSIRGRDEEAWSLRYPESLVEVRLWVGRQYGLCKPQCRDYWKDGQPACLGLEAMPNALAFGPTLKKWRLRKMCV